MRRRFVTSAALLLAVTACAGPGTPTVEPFAVVASANGSLGPGTQRVMFALVDPETDAFLAQPDIPATITLRDENGAPLETYDAGFIWTVPDSRGLYVAYMEFPEAATYQVTIDAEGMATAGPVGVVVFDDPLLVLPGEAAVPSVTRTAATHDIAVISSDLEPDSGMYQLSVHEAISNGTPAVIVFATPAWCVSQTCGPLLDQVKGLRGDYIGVDFVHVEVYEDIQVSSFDELTPIMAVQEWGLPSEPWVFVVDAAGMVTASFEGAASDAELTAAIDAVAR